MTEHIHFILTGGTIDKAYNPVTEKPEMRTETIVADYLEQAVQAYGEYSFDTVCMKDSTELTDEDRRAILNTVQNSPHDKIIIIHGTTTMTLTALFLQKESQALNKTIILTGAMIPLKEFAMSDAGFNLGFAIAEVLNRTPGVYLCMNAKTFKPGEVQKDSIIGRFVESDGKSD